MSGGTRGLYCHDGTAVFFFIERRRSQKTQGKECVHGCERAVLSSLTSRSSSFFEWQRRKRKAQSVRGCTVVHSERVSVASIVPHVTADTRTQFTISKIGLVRAAPASLSCLRADAHVGASRGSCENPSRLHWREHPVGAAQQM